jgi:hypothetical protein
MDRLTEIRNKLAQEPRVGWALNPDDVTWLINVVVAAKNLVDETERIEKEDDYCCSTVHQRLELKRCFE